MLGLTLALLLHAQPVKCVVVNLAPLSVVCGSIELRNIDWPVEWGRGARLTGEYNAEVINGQVIPLVTADDPARDRRIRERTLTEQRRWRRPAMQQQLLGKIPIQ